LKLLRRELEDNPLIVDRFLEEAQIGAQLQHPGVVPVYELGLMADRRPYFTMKLVKGQTLAALLADRSGPEDDLLRFLKIFEQVCQTMAYAHARQVVHRDLKPSNVMLGAFGEVQVVDWGLSKVGLQAETDRLKREGYTLSQISIIETIRSVTPESESMVGSIIGTPAYMPPEQARGDIDKLDPSSDVFSLGAILCEILTGLPPYTGDSNEAVLFNAARGRLDEANERLDRCRAEKRLVNLTRECLSPARRARPPNAGILAKEVGGYLESVEEDARQAQVAAEAARVRAEQEHRARRLTMAAAIAAVLAVVVVGGILFKVSENARASAEAAVEAMNAAFDEADHHRRAADRGEETDLASLERALGAARRAEELAREADTGKADLRRAAELIADLETRMGSVRAEADRQARNRASLAALGELRIARCSNVDPRGTDRAYLACLRERGIDLEAAAPEEAEALIRETGIADEIAAGLSSWIFLRQANDLESDFTGKLTALAELLDPDPLRREIRAAATAAEREARRSWLLRLASDVDVDRTPSRSLALLCEALGRIGEDETVVELLDEASFTSPQDFEIHYELALSSFPLGATGRDNALRHLAAARSMRPDSAELHHILGATFAEVGAADQAIRYYEKALAMAPEGPARDHLHAHIAYAHLMAKRQEEAARALETASGGGEPGPYALRVKGLLHGLRKESGDAVASLDAAVELWPEFSAAHYDRIRAYRDAGRIGALVREYREATEKNPDDERDWIRLGFCHHVSGRPDEAVPAYEKACACDPTSAGARSILGWALLEAGRPEPAAEVLREAVDLAPHHGEARHGLGLALAAIGELDSAVGALTKALESSRRAPRLLTDLGTVLSRRRDEHGAHRALLQAVDLNREEYRAHLGLGQLLLRHGEKDRARGALRAAFRAEPECLCALRLLMASLRRSGELELEIRNLLQQVGRSARDAFARVSLGAALEEAGRFDEALAEYRKATLISDAPAAAWVLLGEAREREGDLEAAGACYEKALEAKPGLPEARGRYGLVLLESGEFVKAVEQLMRSRGACITRPGLSIPVEGWLSEARRMRELADRIPDLLRGGESLVGAREHVEAGRLLLRSGHHVEALPLFTKAFELVPSLLGEARWDNARLAAGAALLRMEGRRPEAQALLRERAVGWLRNALSFLPERLARGEAREVRDALHRWTRDPSLASIRDPARVSGLPEEEQEDCRALWREVEEWMDAATGR
jgi:serine/threonine-protein kinase